MSVIDTWTTEHAGITYRVSVFFDDQVKPSDFDCYTNRQVAAWERDEWHFVGVEVAALLDGLSPGDFSASVWGIDYGAVPLTDENDNLTGKTYDYDAEIRENIVPELIDDVEYTLKPKLLDLRAKISALLYPMGA